MLRKLLFTVVPMLLPFVIYGIYWIGAQRRRQRGVSETPWTVLFASGIALMIAGLIYLRWTTGYEAGKTYVPAHTEDGEVVPAKTE